VIRFFRFLILRLGLLLLAVLVGVILAGHSENGSTGTEISEAPAITCEGDLCWWADLPKPGRTEVRR
jgi:hypothetical protein